MEDYRGLMVITYILLSGLGKAMGQVFDSTTCGVDKTCIEGTVFISWINNGTGSSVIFEMESQAEGYVSLAFSDDTAMGADSVIECVKNSDSTVSIYQSYNTGKLNSRLSSPQQGLSNMNGGVSNGYIWCSFERVHDVASESQIFDISTGNMWWILMAIGNQDGSGGILEHSTDLVSSDQVDLTADPVVLTGSTTGDDMLKAHACILITAWVVLASISMILARYYKGGWPDHKILGAKVWFQLHRVFMIGVLLLHVIGFILVFVHVEGYTDAYGETAMEAHAIIGIIVTVLVIANPIISLFRCGPDSDKRIIFNWVHLIVGVLAHVLAVVTIFLGMMSDRSDDVFIPGWVIYVMIVFVVVHIATELLLEVLKCIKANNSDRSVNHQDISMDDNGAKQDTRPAAESQMLMYIILIVYVVLNFALWLTMIIGIAAY